MAFVLIVAYILQQRLRPFLVSRTLSNNLALDVTDIDTRLTEARRRSVITAPQGAGTSTVTKVATTITTGGSTASGRRSICAQAGRCSAAAPGPEVSPATRSRSCYLSPQHPIGDAKQRHGAPVFDGHVAADQEPASLSEAQDVQVAVPVQSASELEDPARVSELRRASRRASIMIVVQQGSMRALIEKAKSSSFRVLRRALTLLSIAIDYNHLVGFRVGKLGGARVLSH